MSSRQAKLAPAADKFVTEAPIAETSAEVPLEISKQPHMDPSGAKTSATDATAATEAEEATVATEIPADEVESLREAARNGLKIVADNGVLQQMLIERGPKLAPVAETSQSEILETSTPAQVSKLDVLAEPMDMDEEEKLKAQVAEAMDEVEKLKRLQALAKGDINLLREDAQKAQTQVKGAYDEMKRELGELRLQAQSAQQEFSELRNTAKEITQMLSLDKKGSHD
jgi:hypothetical protein